MVDKIVPDASVLLKWFLRDEEWVAQALAMKDAWSRAAVELVTPPHTIVEVISGLWVAHRRQRLPFDQALTAARLFHHMELPVHEPRWVDVLEAAVTWQVSPYDACYATLALETGAAFYTADEALLTSLRTHSFSVRFLSEYPR